jgi:hypothetical protein
MRYFLQNSLKSLILFDITTNKYFCTMGNSYYAILLVVIIVCWNIRIFVIFITQSLCSSIKRTSAWTK